MTLALDDFEHLKRQVDDLTRQRDQAEGALSQILLRLKREFGVNNLKQAKAKLAKLKQERAKAEEDYFRKKAKFVRKWGKKLKGKK